MGYLSGQRWRLTARALRVIIAILQNYEINQLPFPPSADPSTLTIDPTLEQFLLDFREAQGEYLIEGQATPVRCDRQKTAGFTVMALMLGRSRLLECVLALLKECSIRTLEHCKVNAVINHPTISHPITIHPSITHPLYHPTNTPSLIYITPLLC